MTGQPQYRQLVDSTTAAVDGISEQCQQARYQSLYNDIQDEIDQSRRDGQQELDDAKSELDSAKKKLDKAKSTLDQAKADLDAAAKTLQQTSDTLTSRRQQYAQALASLGLTQSQLPDKISELQDNIADIRASMALLDPSSAEYGQLQQQLAAVQSSCSQLESLRQTGQALEAAASQLQIKQQEYDTAAASYQQNLTDYQNNLAKWQNSETEYQQAVADFDKEIADATAKLDELEEPVWYVYDRTDYQTYTDFIDDTKSVSNLSLIFPIIFFAVAVLISLISMNRMVTDERNEIGTLKSLGFTNRQIMHKYLLFANTATISGGIIGSLLGVVIIPSLIFSIYSILFTLPAFILGLNLSVTLIGFFISAVCVCGSTILTVVSVLKEKPAELMRPKAPKAGKRVLLERVTFIWQRLSFSNKITVRNLFRNQRRVLITVFGITGTTALMLCGFGIKDAIVDIPQKQYGHVFTFDGMAYVDNYDAKETASLFDQPEVSCQTLVQNIKVTVGSYDVTVFVSADSAQMSQIISFSDAASGQAVSMETGQVLITDKLAALTGLQAGDTITAVNDNESHDYVIGGIVENYVSHYIFMDAATYQQDGAVFTPNVIYFNTSDLDTAGQNQLASVLLKSDDVLSVSFASTMIDTVNDMLKSLDKVVLILIVLSAMLSFVVLYNLSNINIHERRREIATLKVLGFYDKEVDNYITRETIILSVVGIGLGLWLGIYLTGAVVGTVEIEKCRFIQQIKPLSFVYTALLAGFFTTIVDVFTHMSLKKIDMIESLKSVE